MPMMNCPMCGKAARCDEAHIGRTARCKACGESFVIGGLPGGPDEPLGGGMPVIDTGIPAVALPARSDKAGDNQLLTLRRQIRILWGFVCGLCVAFFVAIAVGVTALNREMPVVESTSKSVTIPDKLSVENLDAKRIRLVDATGNPRMGMVMAGGNPVFLLNDDAGNVRCDIGVKNGTAYQQFYAPGGGDIPRVALGVSNKQAGYFVINDANGTKRLVSLTTANGLAVFGVLDRNGKLTQHLGTRGAID